MKIVSFGTEDKGVRSKALLLPTQSSMLMTTGKARNKRSLYFTLRDAGRNHAYLRTAVSSIGRSIIGPGVELVKHPIYGNEATESEKDTLWDFYYNIGLVQSGVQEIALKHPLSSRLYKLIGSIKLFGAGFWEIRRDRAKRVIGSVPIDGYVHPNVDEGGKFLSPAWSQYISEIGKPVDLGYDDVIPFMWPDWSGPAYETDIESLVAYVLSSDIYMLTSIRELFKNMRAPLGIWSIDPEVDDDAYEEFKATVESVYRGAANFGRSGLTSRGQIEYKPVAQHIKDVPWQQGHQMARDDTFATSGTSSKKLGLDDASGASLVELRHEYWETTSLPLTRVVSDIAWQEIHVGLFDIRGWELRFQPPDFTTALQDASIEMRRIQWGQWSPNEARGSRGEPPRDDGDYYLLPGNMAIQGEQGGAEDPVDAADGEPDPEDLQPVPDSEEPERGDVENAIAEYRTFLMNDVKRGKRRSRRFESSMIPDYVIDFVDLFVAENGLSATVVDGAISAVRDMIDG